MQTKQTNQQNVSETTEGRMLCFFVGQSRFALPLLEVREVVAYTQPTPVPEAGPALRGIINLRGTVIPVMDIRAQLRITGEDAAPGRSILIVQLAGRNVGVVVDDVDSVIAVNAADLSACPDATAAVKTVVKRGDQLILVLDLGRALAGELAFQAEAAAAA